MPRPGRAALLNAATALLLATIAAGLLAAVRLLPPFDLGASEGAWVLPALGWLLAVAAAGASLAGIVAGLRTGDAAAILAAGSAAALAGAAVLLGLGAPSVSLPVLGAAAMSLGAALADRTGTPPIDGSGRRLVVVGTTLALAELFTAGDLVLEAGALPLLVAAGVAVIGAGVAVGRPLMAEIAALAVGASALGIAREGGLEVPIGVAALAASAALGARRAIAEPESLAGSDSDERLPDLAARLADAVLRFDGRLRLADWNATAGTLLSLDETSRGTRMEDLLGVPIAGLPAHDQLDTVERGVGGLDITMHRSGAGVTAIIRDPGRAPESERLSRELRGTIEELMQARRTIELQRAEIERGATVDQLTGLPSRSAILDRLRTEVAEANRYRHPVAVVLLDVDAFAELNRALGTSAGDAVLAEVALRLRLRVRTADALGRLAGDCFLAILPHTDEAGATTFTEALRHRLAGREIVVGRAPVAVTVSGGVAVMHAGETADVDALLARAEEALEDAKAAGGNRVGVDRTRRLAARGADSAEAEPEREGDGAV